MTFWLRELKWHVVEVAYVCFEPALIAVSGICWHLGRTAFASRLCGVSSRRAESQNLTDPQHLLNNRKRDASTVDSYRRFAAIRLA